MMRLHYIMLGLLLYGIRTIRTLDDSDPKFGPQVRTIRTPGNGQFGPQQKTIRTL